MLRKIIKDFLYKIGLLKHPMRKLVLKIQKTISLNDKNCIELFARDGSWSTDLISKELKSIDLVELDSSFKKDLEAKYPKSNIFINDTYEFIKTHKAKYDIVLSDNPASKHGKYFQHFSLFPDVFRILNDQSVLILNIIPDYSLINYNPNQEEEHFAIRNFYHTNSIKLNTKTILATYKELARQNLFEIYKHYSISRRSGVHYLCLFLRRTNDKS